MYLFTSSRHGVAPKELQRQLGVTYKTAWRMAHELRKLMARADELAEDGDLDGRAVWLRIVKAIEELLSEERPGDAEVH